MDTLHIVRRIGPDPHANNQQTPCLEGCPDIFELSNGDFAFIGEDITSEMKAKLPPTAGCGPDEKIVCIPRRILLDAKSDIPG
jgi:hypothetical protein